MSTGMFDTGPSYQKEAARYAADRRALRCLANATGRATDQVGNPARLIRVSVAPVPPVVVYDDWLMAKMSAAKQGSRHTKLTGTALRRAVVMIRSGSTRRDASVATGVCQANLGRWLKELPNHLAPFPAHPTDASTGLAA